MRRGESNDVRGDAVDQFSKIDDSKSAEAAESKLGSEESNETQADTRRLNRNVEVPTAAVVELKKKKSNLQKAIEDNETVSAKDMSIGISSFELNENSRKALSETLAKSLFLKTIMLTDLVAVLEQKVPEESASILTEAFRFIKAKKSEAILLKMVEHSKLDLLPVIAKDKEGEALQQFLEDNDLLSLAPVADLSKDIAQQLEAGNSPDTVLEFVNKEIEAKLSAASLAAVAGEHLGKAIFKTESSPNVDVIESYSMLLKRLVCQPKDDVLGQLTILFKAQGAWAVAKMPKG